MMHHALLLNQKYEGGEATLEPGFYLVIDSGTQDHEPGEYRGFSVEFGIGSLIPSHGFTNLYILKSRGRSSRAPGTGMYLLSVHCTRPFYWSGWAFTDGQTNSADDSVDRLYTEMSSSGSLTVTLT